MREVDGAHTFFLIFGFNDIVAEFYEKLMDAIGLPEAAVIAVQDKVVTPLTVLPSLGVLPDLP